MVKTNKNNYIGCFFMGTGGLVLLDIFAKEIKA